jgi:hypothetical protein
MRRWPFVLFFIASIALAQESVPPPPDLEPVPDGSPVVGETELEGELQPEVTIRRRAEGVIEEYRIGGRLYMVRVVPTRGVPYFLLDTDGDGDLETRYNDLANNMMIPGWVIMRW